MTVSMDAKADGARFAGLASSQSLCYYIIRVTL